MLPAVNGLGSTAGEVAIAAAAVAVVAVLLCGVLALKLRRLRADQRAVLRDGQEGDLVAHAASLQREFEALYDYAERSDEVLTKRLQDAERRLDRAVAYHALIRYDAYGEMSGRQSTSIALLDAHHSGLVLSSIHHRDQARLYAKEVHEGQAEIELSPEENEAIRLALGEGTASRPPD